MNPDRYEISYLRYRRDVVSRWPSSPYKSAVVNAIESRLERLMAALAAPVSAQPGESA